MIIEEHTLVKVGRLLEAHRTLVREGLKVEMPVIGLNQDAMQLQSAVEHNPIMVKRLVERELRNIAFRSQTILHGFLITDGQMGQVLVSDSTGEVRWENPMGSW